MPSISNLKPLGTVREGVEQIAGSTFGLSGILSAWSDFLKVNRVPQFNVLMVNMLTMIRNAYHKELSDTEIFEQVSTDIKVLSYYFNEFKNHMHYNKDAYLLIYIPSYHQIPKIYLREQPPSDKIISDILKRLIDKEFPEDEYRLEHMDLPVYITKVGKIKFPHLELIDKVKLYSEHSLIHNTYATISHYPIDYHFGGHVRNNFTNISSHTGDHWTYKTLGRKIFKNDFIPFNDVTHLLMGDPIVFKNPLNVRDRRMINELAKKDNWLIKTKQQILNDVSKILPKTYFTSINL